MGFANHRLVFKSLLIFLYLLYYIYVLVIIIHLQRTNSIIVIVTLDVLPNLYIYQLPLMHFLLVTAAGYLCVCVLIKVIIEFRYSVLFPCNVLLRFALFNALNL